MTRKVTFTIDAAHDWIELLRKARPTCDACEKKSYDALFRESPGAMTNGLSSLLKDGWEHLVDQAGVVRRCATCSVSQKHPWADRLDAERVREFVLQKLDAGELATADELRKTVES